MNTDKELCVWQSDEMTIGAPRAWGVARRTNTTLCGSNHSRGGSLNAAPTSHLKGQGSGFHHRPLSNIDFLISSCYPQKNQLKFMQSSLSARPLEPSFGRFATLLSAEACVRPVYDQILTEFSDCVVTPTLGSILPFWLLIIP